MDGYLMDTWPEQEMAPLAEVRAFNHSVEDAARARTPSFPFEFSALDRWKQYFVYLGSCVVRANGRVEKRRISDSDWEDPNKSPDCGWVFYSPQPPTSPPDELENKVIHGLQKSLVHQDPASTTLFQFYAATPTPDGRTLLTTQKQPFALTKLDKGLCEYRVISKDHEFYADGQNDNEHLGILRRVFLNKRHESTPNVKSYSTEEYPLRDHALRCGVRTCWAFPVFEPSTQNCVGVLEIVGTFRMDYITTKSLCDAFQAVGLQCFDVCKHHEKRQRSV